MYELSPWGVPEGLMGDTQRKAPTPPELQPCEVHDVLAYGKCYIVKPVGMPRMPAVLGSLTSSMLPIGGRDMTMLVPGSVVLCWISDRYYATILAVLASPVGSSQAGWPDSIVAGSSVGLFADAAHNQAVVSKETANGFLDFSSGGPIDGLPGDWGHTNELGMAFFLGRLMSSIRAGELCKLELHYVDMLARLYAYNWQHYTAGSEEEAFNDEGEWTRIRGFSPFPWEAHGAAGLDIAAFKDQATVDPKDAAGNMAVEPSSNLQGSFVRYKELEGFLGDLRRSFVVMPADPKSIRTYGRSKTDAAQYKGLFEEVLSVDGSYLLRSAKSIGFEKSLWIPVPEELYPRDNPNGDHDMSNPAGLNMDFSEYPGQATAGKEMARVRDAQSHELNKRKSEPLNQRDKDWAIRDSEGSIQVPGGFTEEVPPLTPYTTFENKLPPDRVETVCPVGGRSSRYYQSKAFMGILPDGSILLRDGYGSEIKMSGGNIELTCPGDAIIRNGRTVQVWGGKDVIIKSQGNLELSSATDNVRIKAEHNLELLGGNDLKGGVLIESRGSGDVLSNDFKETGDSAVIGGLVLKSSLGPISMWGDSLYMRSTSGDIVIDSQGGDNDFTLYCRNCTKYLTQSSKEVTAAQKSATPEESTYIFENVGGFINYYGLEANFGVRRLNLIASKGDTSTSSLVVAGNIAAEGTVAGLGEFRTYDEAPKTSWLDSLRKYAQSKFSAENKAAREWIKFMTENDGAPGNEDTWGLIGFSFRSSEDLNLGSMIIYEAEWQKRFRQSDGVPATGSFSSVWEEPDVSGRIDPETRMPDTGRLTKPFPGKEAWDTGEEANYSQVDDQFYVTTVNGSVYGGRPLPRGEKGDAYSKVNPPAFSEGPFKGRYPINKV